MRLRIRFGYARIKILLINIPIIILYSTVFFIIFEKLDSVIASIVVVLVLITEICGLIIFQGRYTRFEYAYANLTFKTADPLLRVNVDKILERGKWIIIEQNNCKLKILQDDLLQIEYFGRAKYVFHKESLKIKSPILKKALDQLEYLLDISKHLDKWKNAKLQKLSKS